MWTGVVTYHHLRHTAGLQAAETVYYVFITSFTIHLKYKQEIHDRRYQISQTGFSTFVWLLKPFCKWRASLVYFMLFDQQKDKHCGENSPHCGFWQYIILFFCFLWCLMCICWSDAEWTTLGMINGDTSYMYMQINQVLVHQTTNEKLQSWSSKTRRNVYCVLLIATPGTIMHH